MEDLMLIRSSFMRRIISSAINKVIAKQKYGITINLDAEMPKADLMDILKKAGIC